MTKDTNVMNNMHQSSSIIKKKHSCFEWVHLIATICIPIIIAIYTIIDNNNSALIAEANHRKDIAIANISRTAELEIAEASRQKDRELAIDQQHEDILVQYQSSLANLLMEDNSTLTKRSSMTKTVVQFMTRTALSQLDLKRKSFLVRSIYDAGLITLQASSTIGQETILEFRQIDLSYVIFGPINYSQDSLPLYHYVEWNYLTLPHSILVHSSFRHTILDCAEFRFCTLNSADFSFIRQQRPLCYNVPRLSNTNFHKASLINASFYRSIFYYTNFGWTDLTYANMSNFYCRECHFQLAILIQAELSFSRIIHAFNFAPYRLVFAGAKLIQSTLHSTFFHSINFDQSDWSGVQATNIGIKNSTFNGTVMINASFVQGYIISSQFENATLFNMDLSHTTLYNVSFFNVGMQNANLNSMQCIYCDFTNVKFDGVIFKNASFQHCIFIDSIIDDNQLAELYDLTGSTLSNGTIIGINN